MKQHSSFSDRIKNLAPLSRAEFPKFIFSSLMLMLIIYVYSILRATKDSLVVGEFGAELLSAIKLYGVLPSAILFMLLYTKLVDMFKRSTLFHILNWSFVSFFCIFSLLLYPNSASIHFDVTNLVKAVPQLKYLFVMLGGWSISLFYILSELWGSVVLSLLFWQLANQVTEMEQAKRFYPLFGLLGQVGLFMAGVLGDFFASGSLGISWEQTLRYITLSIFVAGLAISYSLNQIKSIVGEEVVNGEPKKGKKKVKMSFFASLKYITSSKPILLITLLILCYGTTINLVEGAWKKSLETVCFDSALKEETELMIKELSQTRPESLEPSEVTATPLNLSKVEKKMLEKRVEKSKKQKYSVYMAKVQKWTAIFTAIAMTCGVFLLRKISWKFAASLTPITIFVTGLAFFAFTIFSKSLDARIAAAGLTAMSLAAFFGAVQNVLSKGVKYAFFDPTKEMAYIPLDPDLKSKGKAAADVVGGRLGKSSGAFIQQLALAAVPGSTLLSLSPVLCTIFLIIMVTWFISVGMLSKEFEASSAAKAAESQNS